MNSKRGLGGSASFRFPTEKARADLKIGNIGRKGQITIFIIIGITLLFTFAGILYITKTLQKETLTTSGDPVIVSVPQEFQPIQSFTENCLRQASEKGLVLLGQQGGYIYPNLVGEFSEDNPTDGDGIDLGAAKVPYWHFNKEANVLGDVIYSSWQPKLYGSDDEEMSIEAQLARFVEEYVPGCLNNYSSFQEQGFVIQAPEQPRVSIRIAEESVGALLQYHLESKKGEALQEMEQFYVKLPLRLKHYYDVASEITTVERDYQFLERFSLDTIRTFSDVDPVKLPPIEGFSFEPVPPAIWNEQVVKQNIQNLLISQVPLLRYLSSKNFYRYDYFQGNAPVQDLTHLYQKQYDNSILPLELAKDVDLSFDYFGWQPYVNLNDKAGMIQPSSASVSYLRLQVTTHHYYTTYDVSYPVLISIEDPAALGGRGYTFTFALEANIRNNEIPEQNYQEPPPIGSSQQSLACNNDTWTSPVLQALVVDSSTSEPVEAVQIAFTIPNYDSCIMGFTDDRGEFASTYPEAIGGIGSFVKKGYLTNFYPLDTYHLSSSSTSTNVIGYAVSGTSDGTSEPVVQMHPYKKVNVSVMIRPLYKCIKGPVGKINDLVAFFAGAVTGIPIGGDPAVVIAEGTEDVAQSEGCFRGGGLFGGNGPAIYSYVPEMTKNTHIWRLSAGLRPLAEHETTTVILNRVGDVVPGVQSDSFMAAVTLSGTGEPQAETELVPGVYEVMALVQRTEPYIIPKEERCTGGIYETALCQNVEGCCFPFDESSQEEMLVGQLQWDNETSYLTITPEQLYGAQELVIPILGIEFYEVPPQAGLRVLEDLQAMGQLGNLSQHLRQQLQPRFQ